MKLNICKKCNNSHIQRNSDLCPECLEMNKNGDDIYSGEALKQNQYVKKLLDKGHIELKNGNLSQAKKFGGQAESLQPNCSTVLTFMGEVCKACGEEALSIIYFTRAMQTATPEASVNKDTSLDYPRHIWMALLLLLFVVASAIAMMIAVGFKKTEHNNHVNVITSLSVIAEPAWIWQDATVYNVEKDKTNIPESEINMTGALDAYNSGNYRRSTAIYTRLLKSKDPDIYIYQYLAYSYQRLGDSQHALLMLQNCVKKCSMKNEKDMQSVKKTKLTINKLLNNKKAIK